MHIVALAGSPHQEKGNTSRLLDIVLQETGERGIGSETVHLPGGTVLPCRGCGTCHKKGVCPRDDEMGDIVERIHAARGLVLASPNYIFNVSAQLKAFLDRCCGIIHRMAFEGKYGAAVITSGGGGDEPIADYLQQSLIAMGVLPVGSVTAVMGSGQGEPFPDEVAARARQLGDELASACLGERRFPQMQERLQEFKGRIRALVEANRDIWPYEYEFWQQRKTG